MSGIVDAMDVGMSCMDPQHQSMLCSKNGRNVSMLAAYGAIGLWCMVCWEHLSDKDFSIILTLSSIMQLLGFILLALKVRSLKSAAGLSSKSLEVYFVFFCFRLASTMFKQGYLPLDRSGDWVYQAGDAMSILMVLHLLYTIHKTFGTTYQAEHDTLDVMKVFAPLVVLAYLLKADLNQSPFFDTMWMLSVLVDTVAMLPQIFMLSKIGGKVDGLTSHYVLCMTLSRLFVFVFWWTGYSELHVEGETYNKTGAAVLVCNGLQLLFCADFMYYYLKGMVSGGAVMLPNIDV